jgi:hypothetical protein
MSQDAEDEDQQMYNGPYHINGVDVEFPYHVRVMFVYSSSKAVSCAISTNGQNY